MWNSCYVIWSIFLFLGFFFYIPLNLCYIILPDMIWCSLIFQVDIPEIFFFFWFIFYTFLYFVVKKFIERFNGIWKFLNELIDRCFFGWVDVKGQPTKKKIVTQFSFFRVFLLLLFRRFFFPLIKSRNINRSFNFFSLSQSLICLCLDCLGSYVSIYGELYLIFSNMYSKDNSNLPIRAKKATKNKNRYSRW